MFLTKHLGGYPISDSEILEILKRYSNHGSIDSFLLDCLYSSLLVSCNFRNSNFWLEWHCPYPEQRNKDLKQSIKTVRDCIEILEDCDLEVDDLYQYVEKLRELRLKDLVSIKQSRRKARYRKKTRREYYRLKPKLKTQLLEKFESKCAHCESTERLEIDHITPVFRRGDNDINNLQILCRDCHLIKSVNERRA